MTMPGRVVLEHVTAVGVFAEGVFSTGAGVETERDRGLGFGGQCNGPGRRRSLFSGARGFCRGRASSGRRVRGVVGHDDLGVAVVVEDIALRVFELKGFDATTIDDIGSEADLLSLPRVQGCPAVA